MNFQIHKETFEVGIRGTVAGTPLSTGLDGTGQLCVWFRTDGISHTCLLIGTGGSIPDDMCEFLGSVTDRRFVWHCFVGIGAEV